MYLERPLKDFVKDTASRTPTPGGGSVAALVGALGGCLLSMVGNFTLGKEEFKLVEEEVRAILKKLDFFISDFCRLIQEDISAYGSFSRASSLPKKTPEEKKKRSIALQEALKRAAEVPLKMCEECVELLKIASCLFEIGNPRLISDVGVGAILAEACLESAALNVEINLSYIKDKVFVEEKRKLLRGFLEEGGKLADEVVKKVKEKIG